MAYKRILLVDDDNLANIIHKSVMQKCNFSEDYVIKSCPLEALTYLFSNQDLEDLMPQIIFLDINMPRMNGFEFLKEYSKLPLNVIEKVNIYILSSSSCDRDKEEADNFKFLKGYLTKPLSKDKLLTLMS
jgi:CheY-like chemotaxis protein